jgi:ring-1,2-phenylacetyl-CoA epoxidase subunit PaaD
VVSDATKNASVSEALVPPEALSQHVWSLLEQVPDPEIPVISVVDLGIVRSVRMEGATAHVTLTPTYSGCPATRAIEQSVREHLERHGISTCLQTTFTPPWTTDWITPQARERLRDYGITPPEPRSGPIPCPFCSSSETRLQSEFGSTPCKALHFCKACLQPFEQFKCV